jgi:hypothetical protein
MNEESASPHAEMRRRRLRWLGSALVVYGVIGVLIFLALAVNISRPLEQLNGLATSVEDQRTLALDALDSAATSLRQTSAGVTNMDASLAEVQVATTQAAGISRDVATSMHALAGTMQLTIPVLGLRPFAGLADGFTQAGDDLDLLADDLRVIGDSLDQNRADAQAVGQSLNDLSLTVGQLSASVRAAPAVDFSDGSLQVLALGLLAISIWLLALAAACLGAGAILLWGTRRVPSG